MVRSSVAVRAGDSLLFAATALHGIEAIQKGPVSYLSVVLTLCEQLVPAPLGNSNSLPGIVLSTSINVRQAEH